MQAGGGGDTPEALNEALHETVHRLSWRTDAARMVVLVADAPPHLDYGGPQYDVDMQAALAKGIKLFAVGASGLDPVGEYIYRQMAQYTAGRFVFLTYKDAADPGSGPGTQTVHDVRQLLGADAGQAGGAARRGRTGTPVTGLMRSDAQPGRSMPAMTRAARLLALLPLLLAGCGGGLYIGWGDYGDGTAPSVSIATAQASVPAGGVLRVVAAASDNDSGIDDVAFYRIDGSADVRLGSDGSPPYEWDFVAPNDGRATLRVFARARDGAGNEADSLVLAVPVTP